MPGIRLRHGSEGGTWSGGTIEFSMVLLEYEEKSTDTIQARATELVLTSELYLMRVDQRHITYRTPSQLWHN